MTKFLLPAFLACLGVLSLTSCYDPLEYWQRSSAPSTAYLTGGQAQALLEKDISQCTCGTDTLRNIVTDDDQAEEYQHNALDGTQPGDPREFRACMQARGWQRVDPYFAKGQTEERLDHYQSVSGNRPQCAM
jgi:hypothetical protein